MIRLCTAPAPPDSTRGTIYFPFIAVPPTTIDGLSPTCAEFLRLLIGDPRQEHESLTVCSSLVLSATWRATLLANGAPWSHCDGNGDCANRYARRSGCVLPDWYSENGNQVESIAAGADDPQVIFDALASSPKHAAHLFGRGWFRHQTHIGIAMVAGGAYGFYWVFHLASCGQVSGE